MCCDMTYRRFNQPKAAESKPRIQRTSDCKCDCKIVDLLTHREQQGPLKHGLPPSVTPNTYR